MFNAERNCGIEYVEYIVMSFQQACMHGLNGKATAILFFFKCHDIFAFYTVSLVHFHSFLTLLINKHVYQKK